LKNCQSNYKRSQWVKHPVPPPQRQEIKLPGLQVEEEDRRVQEEEIQGNNKTKQVLQFSIVIHVV
jgi:hypothetical protein